MKSIETNYANTDFDIISETAFDVLNAELTAACCVLHYCETHDGKWTASYEADRLNDCATSDILAFVEVLKNLSEKAKREFANSTKRDFNVGIHCWDTWAFNLLIPHSVVEAAAAVGCSISVTLYPMREPDGTPKLED